MSSLTFSSSTISPTAILEQLQSIVTHLQCPVCLSIMDDAHIIPDCGHRFCGNCIKSSLRLCKNECPSCRTPVATKRRLRCDDIFDNLIQKLSGIIEESTNESNGDVDYSILLDSFKALLWHFQCPICSKQLNETHMATECLHRFCKECILETQAVSMGVSIFTCVQANSKNNCIYTKCTCCRNESSHNSKFLPDQQFESINQAIQTMLDTLEISLSNNAKESSNPIDGVKIEYIKDDSLSSSDDDEDIISEHVKLEEFSNFDCDDVNDIFDLSNVKDTFNKKINDPESSDKVINRKQQDDEECNTVKNNLDTSAGSNGQRATFEPNDHKAENEEDQTDGKKEDTTKRRKATYATGSGFVKKEQNRQIYGRIVGFNGAVYQVYFPHDKSCQEYTEESFKSVHFIQSQKRPTKPRVVARKIIRSSDQVLRCKKCNSKYSSNAENILCGRIPVQSNNCAHNLCFNCVQSMRMGAERGRNLRVTVDCPFCKKAQSFNAVQPTICVAMCQMVSLYEGIEQQRKEDKLRNKSEGSNKNQTKRKKERKTKESSDDLHIKKRRQDDESGNQHKASPEKKARHKQIKCKICQKDKLPEKFSSKQLEKLKKKSRPTCRRCEEKGIVEKYLGSGSSKVSTTLRVAKDHGKKPKFLTTIVPWKNGKAIKVASPLPSNLTIDGYTRDSWGQLNNIDTQEEQCWLKSNFWSTGNGILKFLQFLVEHKKSAYGTFVLPDNTDGFIVIPYDQTVKSVKHVVFQCKYVLGLGLVSEGYINRNNNNINDDQLTDGAQQSSSTLKQILAAEWKTNQALAVVPHGSVKVAQKLVSRPDGPSASVGATNWFRQRIVIEENDEDEGSDNDSTLMLKKKETDKVQNGAKFIL